MVQAVRADVLTERGDLRCLELDPCLVRAPVDQFDRDLHQILPGLHLQLGLMRSGSCPEVIRQVGPSGVAEPRSFWFPASVGHHHPATWGIAMVLAVAPNRSGSNSSARSRYASEA